MSVTARGGYQIIDIPVAIPISDDETQNTIKVPGIFEKAKNSENKPIIVSALLNDGTRVLPQYGESFGFDEENQMYTIRVVTTASTPIGLAIFANDNVTYSVEG